MSGNLRTARRGLLGGFLLVAVTASPLTAATLQIGSLQATPAGSVGQYEKLEISFQITGSNATMMQWPYDPLPPNGIPPGVGITVNAVFTDPDGRQVVQPAFFSEQFLDEVRDGRDWHLPTGSFLWRVRFSPTKAGTWSYKIVATDRGGTFETSPQSFSVTASGKKGFVRVSRKDPRYFEFDDGTPFNGMGFEFGEYLDDPVTKGGPAYAKLHNYGINFVRLWVSSIYGSAWTIWLGGRNQYRGYLPVTGLMPFTDTTTGQTTLTMRMDYETAGDTGWFDACRFEFWDDPESIKPNTTYRIRVQYHGENITGPREPSASSNYGLVAKIGGWHPDCYQPGTGTPVTNYGGNNAGFGYIEGTWYSGSLNYLPRIHLGLENVLQGQVYVQSVSLREDLGNGNLGPEMIIRSSMEDQLYIPEEKAYSLDKTVENAERNGVYLKLVIMDKSDKIYFKMADDGGWANPDNEDGFYGIGRGVNKTRWLQQMWWRYLQARWGYSPNIQSWELTNEGDPLLTTHYQMADEFGKFMHCRVFGVDPGAGDAAPCTLNHPNAHMVTTSFWQYFPAPEFWANAKYPNVDFADLHAYVSTSYAPLADKQLMQYDAAYFHEWHSRDVAAAHVGKPVVRGETGLDSPDSQSESVLGLDRDTTGVWLHNFLWAGLDSGGLYENYWWTSHIWNGTFDNRVAYTTVQAFMSGIPLNSGGYADWGGTVTNSSLRVVGQKNVAEGSLHLWVQNRQHTWKNVVDHAAIAPASGDVVVPGFRPGAAYSLERWDTYTPGGRVASVESLTADSAGNLRIAVSALVTDVALKVKSAGATVPRPPTDVKVIKN
jgi:hypothetical protein